MDNVDDQYDANIVSLCYLLRWYTLEGYDIIPPKKTTSKCGNPKQGTKMNFPGSTTPPTFWEAPPSGSRIISLGGISMVVSSESRRG